MKRYKILIIDDEGPYCETLKTNLYQIGVDRGIEIETVDRQNWRDGMRLLEDSFFHGLVLDAKCIIEPSQQTEDFGFLGVALDELNELEKRLDRHVPFVVNTGYIGERETEAMKSLVQRRKGKIFSKSLPKEDLVDFLTDEIEKTPDTKIEREYQDVFEIFNKAYLDDSVRIELLNSIKKLNDRANARNNFNSLRKIYESILKKLNMIVPKYLPNGLFHSDGRPNLSQTYKYFEGQATRPRINNPDPIREKHFLENICFLKNISSILSHDATPYRHDVSIYAYRSAVFALLETLLWFKKFMERP